MAQNIMRVGIIGGGLMGREAASAFARWFVLNDFPVRAELVAVCDLQQNLLDWFKQIPTVKLLTKDHAELLRSPDVDVVYVAVPHNLHEKMYLDVLNAGKDLLAEKPFGIDLAAAQKIAAAAKKSGRFVRCSSEFPFLPGPQRVLQAVQSGKLGCILEIHSGFHHSSDMDPTKPVNWKRQVKTCGEIGVMGTSACMPSMFLFASGGHRFAFTLNCKKSTPNVLTAKAGWLPATLGTMQFSTPKFRLATTKSRCGWK
jgi:predicted dehydrogenase